MLQNGKVLVAGGHPGNLTATATAEVFNPYANTWTAVASMKSPRRSFGACTLANGQVLVAGGNATSGDVTSAELYNPTTNTWTLTGSLATAREDFSMTCLVNGEVLVAGGSGTLGLVNTAELYNPTSGTWSTAGTLPYAIHTQGAVQLTNGNVLIAGGNTGVGPTTLAAIWSPTTNAWTLANGMINSRAWFALNLLNDGRVLAAGGLVNSLLATTNAAEIYNPTTGNWTATTNMSVARYSGVSATLPAGPIVVGGVNGGAPITSSELYNNATGTWSLQSGVYGAVNQTATVLPSGDLFVAGGNTGSAATQSAQLYGTCSNSTASNGTACNSGNQCTTGDSCLSGVCYPGPDVASCQAPAWSAGVLYPVNATVTYAGQIYRSLQTNTSTASLPPSSAPLLWQSIDVVVPTVNSPPAWYGNGAQYQVGDVVSYNGTTYQAVVANTSSPSATPPSEPGTWKVFNVTTGTPGTNFGTCLPASTTEPIDHCDIGLGCDWTTGTCGACGGQGQPCCDGPNTEFAGTCYTDPTTGTSCAICNVGSCNAVAHVCQACGSVAGAACCPPTSSNPAATCSASGLGCAFVDSTMTSGTCAACGGMGAPPCTGNTCQPGLTLQSGVCVASNPSVPLNPPDGLTAWISASVTGPLTLQGAAPWLGCSTTTGGPDEPSFPPCPALLSSSSAPRWTMGTSSSNGFNVTDQTQGQPLPKLYVSQPNVTLAANVSYTDDTSDIAVTINPTAGVGSKACTWTILPELVEGNHAHYVVAVQQWSDNVPAANCPSTTSPNPDYPSVDNAAPSPDGLSGCWQNVTSQETDLYGSSFGSSSATVAAENGTVRSTISIPVTLSSVSNYLRYVVTVTEADTRIAQGPVGWTSIDASSGIDDICPANQVSVTNGCTGQTCYVFNETHPVASSQFYYSAALNPFQLVVQPWALAQLKVLPYTLIYAPPGNASTASYQTSTSFGVGYTFDDKLNNTSSNAVDNKSSEMGSVSNNGSALGKSLGGVGLGMTLSSSSAFDNDTETGVGTIGETTSNTMSTLQDILSLAISDSTTIPGANGTRQTEPFNGDTFVLLVHPQVGLWQIGGQPVVSLLAARGTPANPDFFETTVADLTPCANGTGPYASGGALANGMPIPGVSDVLTSAECSELLSIDVLATTGQSFPGVSSNPRFIAQGATNYGVDPSSLTDDKVTIQQMLTTTTVSSAQTNSSYNATVTDVVQSSSSFGANASGYGFNIGDTLTNTETQTTKTTWTVTLNTTQTATAASSVTVTGTLDDHHGLMGTTALPYQPYVQLYQDSVFGSLVFVDPTAP
jgi:N-acetylneuraminic acid mutarotase